jgi:ribosomal protein S4
MGLESEESGLAVALHGGKSLADVVEGPCFIRLDKLLRESGLADSSTDAVRKIKQNSVRVDGQLMTSTVFIAHLPVEITVKVGKKIKSVALLK